MAHLFPSALPPREIMPGIARELETLALLKSRLPISHSVFHGVHWTRGWSASPVFGEADFILVNGAGACLVIEQKSGALLEGEAGLEKRYDSGTKSVPFQIHRTLDGLRSKFSRQTGRKLDLDYLLFCPDHRVRNVAAAGLDAERIVDVSQSSKLHQRILELLPEADPTVEGARVQRFFEQCLDLTPDIHARTQLSDRCFSRAVGGLADSVGCLTGFPLRLAVRGTAGCGKSLVALKAYRRYVDRGARPLLLCFNRDLKEKMKAVAGSGGVVETFHGAIDRILEATGRPLAHDGTVDWDRAADMVLEGSIPDDWRFDAVIVDEGQDFAPAWRDMLDLFAKPDGDRIWLDDPDQAIQFGRAPDDARWPQDGWTGYRTRLNYRSPASISRFIKAALPEFDFEAANPLPGLGVGVTEVADRDGVAVAVGAIAADLVGRGFTNEQVIVLSLKGQGSATLATQTRVGGRTLSRFTGAYDLFGNQVWSKGALRFDTIRRYKGQQDCAVIITDVEQPDSEVRGPEWRRLLFAALTRATERVEFVALKSGSASKMLQDAL